MNTPANSFGTIHEMEYGLAAMEEALQDHSFHPDAEFTLGVDGGQTIYDLISDAIEDMKVALAYEKSGILCPDCMAISNADSKPCCSCELEFEE